MIAFIQGEIDEIRENSIIMDHHGFGYEIMVPQTVFRALPPLHTQIRIYTHLQVKEDGVALFGFLQKDELAVFKLLITVNGIGPKGALSILSALSADELRFAVLAEDAKAIAKAPGIGAKTASKLVLELKDKFRLEDAFEKRFENSVPQAAGDHSHRNVVEEEAIQALTALGYGSSEAMKAVRQVTITDEMGSDQVLGQALKHIG